MSYNKMALVYDLLMEDAPYEEWTTFTNAMIDKYGKTPVQNIIDLGCGTGQITRRLANHGYNLLGVDYSEDMLIHAQNVALEDQLTIQWFQQDLRDLSGFKDLDMAVSFCDVVNYITEESDVQTVFRNVNQVLKIGGLFLFDIHSLHHVEADLKGQTFAEIYDDITYVWLCEEGEHEGEVFHDLTFFLLDNDQYDRFDEKHHQRTYPIQIYTQWLHQAGFEVKALYADFETETVGTSENSERIFFVCEKIRG